jgi:DHA3 family macrolide efflux protein-like MFS transporter
MNRLRTFYFLVGTQTLSIIGSRVTNIAIGIQIFITTGSATPLLLTTFFSEFPAMLGNSFTGVLVDRWDRRWVLMLTDAGQALGSLILIASFLSGHFELWHLYTVALLQGIFAMFHEPAKDTTTVLLVAQDRRIRANAIQEMSLPLAGVVAPALAGVFYFTVGIVGIVVIDFATFLIAVAAVYLIQIPNATASAEGRAARGSVLREWRGGLRFLRMRPALFALVIYYGLFSFLVYGPLELSIPYLMSITHSESLSGIILAVTSLGALIGATLMMLWSGKQYRVQVLLVSLMVTGSMFLIYGATRNPILLGLSIFVLMIPLPVSWTLLTSLLVTKTPPDLQGRVFSIAMQMSYIGSTLSFLVTGPLADHVFEPLSALPGEGMGMLLIGAGAAILLVTLGVFLFPAIRRLENHVPDYDAIPAPAAGD